MCVNCHQLSLKCAVDSQRIPSFAGREGDLYQVVWVWSDGLRVVDTSKCRS